jgi:oligopeptide/dipeptide ABC transporter ATP-binding protein
MDSLLSVHHLKVELPIAGTFYPAVDDVSFDLSAGESLAIVGESGCGKSLLARALIDLAPETARVSGQVRLRGRSLRGLTERDWTSVRGRQIAMVFQESASAFDPVRTIGDQIVEAIRAHSSVSATEARASARRLLTEVSFPEAERALSEYPHRLSGGERQRAFLAVALAANPEILIADEPTTALDATIAAEILDLLESLRRTRNLALILISHDLAAVARASDRVLVLYAGRVVEEALSRDLFASPMHPYTRGLVACAPRLRPVASNTRLSAIPGVVPELAKRRTDSCGFAPRCAERFSPCDREEPSLEQQGSGRVRCFLYGPDAKSVGERR